MSSANNIIGYGMAQASLAYFFIHMLILSQLEQYKYLNLFNKFIVVT